MQSGEFDWKRVAYVALASRAIDDIEEKRLVPEKRVLYQFSARGHEVSQAIMAGFLRHQGDAVGAYYRSRPILLSLGLSLEDAFASPMAKSGGFSDGRDIGVVCNLPSRDGPSVLPMSGDVGSQFTPSAGWAQSLVYRREHLKETSLRGAVAVAHTGDGGVATSGFWSALTIATTLRLPLLFYVEDNGYGISVPSLYQTPGGNIAANLAAFKNLLILESEGWDIGATHKTLQTAFDHLRGGEGPVLARISVPRLSGHSGQDTQSYKSKDTIEQEWRVDPLPKLKAFCIEQWKGSEEWEAIEHKVSADVAEALEAALARPDPSPSSIRRHVFCESGPEGGMLYSRRGGLGADGHTFPAGASTPTPEPTRINMITAIRRTLEHELKTNPKVLVFGEDVGPKGGVHAATLGLQEQFGSARVFDTSLSEEGIIGRAVGMALNGLLPVAEIQFRKYADPATEQLNNCGTIRWRTNNRFAAPIVVRMPGGFFKCGDPWHSVSGEVQFIHQIGWQVCMPSNAEDAVGLLRAAMRSPNPTIFFEHRHMLDAPWARRPYPGDDYVLPFGSGSVLQEGNKLTCVTWGAMTERCAEAAASHPGDVELIDLRSLAPWDRSLVLQSVRKTRRCLVVHEDGLTAGFGAEIAAALAEHAFFDLDAPIRRIAVPDLPIPHNVDLMEAVVPSTEAIDAAMIKLLED
jgi:2-oxoisovalerate dehydrogenase E1 component